MIQGLRASFQLSPTLEQEVKGNLLKQSAIQKGSIQVEFQLPSGF